MKPYGAKRVPTDQMLSTRQEASAAGHRFYFSGEICKHGHKAPRYTSSSMCVTCVSIASKRYYDAKKSMPRKPYFYSDYIKDQNKQNIETISITVPKESDLHKTLKGTREALKSLDLKERYGRDNKTAFEMPTTKEEAEKSGQKYYFNWQLCRNGHIAPRTLKSECCQCNRDLARKSVKNG